jgi:hypothetical protein
VEEIESVRKSVRNGQQLEDAAIYGDEVADE